MTPLDDLISRLEAATSGSRELDGLVWRVVCPEGDWQAFDGVWHLRDPEDSVAFTAPAPYTTSLETAMTLVPEGMPVDLHIGPRGLGNDAVVYEPVRSIDEQGRRVTTFRPHEARAAREGVIHWNPPAVQLCIACLRARSTLPETEG